MDLENCEIMFKIMRENILEFVGDISSDLRCIICKNVLIEACNAPCGCRFCLLCITNYLKDGNQKCCGESTCCDIDFIDMENDININRIFNKRISRLTVKCINVGCQSQVELSMIADHLRICENQPQQCPYFNLGCDEDKLGGDKMSNHLSMESFSHTKLLLNWMSNSRNEIESLKKDVEQLRSDNVELKGQIRRDGERTNIIIGDLKKRERENSLEIEKLGDEMVALKNSNRLLKEKLKSAKEKQTQQISQLKAQVENQKEEIEQLKQKCEMIETKYDEILPETQKSQGLQMKSDKIFQSMRCLKIATADLAEKFVEKHELSFRTNRCEFEWKIDNWAEIERKARNGSIEYIYSNSFSTDPKGYEMCLAIQPCGSFHIFFCIFKGRFDNSLRWPFDGEVEISLMNQKTGIPQQIRITKCAEYPKHPQLQKPKSERNEALHIYTISPKEISQNLELIKNNQIFLRCSVKLTEHKK